MTELTAIEIVERLLEGRERAFESFCEVNLKMLKAEHKLSRIASVVKNTKGGSERSEYHRGWTGCCDMIEALLKREV